MDKLRPSGADDSPNRDDRRFDRRYDGNTRLHVDLSRQYDMVVGNLVRTESLWTNEILENDKVVTRIVYQAQPIIFTVLDGHSKLHEFGNAITAMRAKGESFNQAFLDNLEGNTMFAHKRNGISLDDLEKFDYPLSDDSIRQINRLMRSPRFFERISAKDKDVVQDIIYLASIPHAQPETQKTIPKSIRNLQAVVTSYFDYYAALFDNDALSPEDEFKLNSTFQWNRAFLLPGLTSFIPGRLQISPASTMKLFEHHVKKLQILGIDVWPKIASEFDRQLQYAYRKHGAQPDLVRYLGYDPEMDAQATHALRAFFSGTFAEDTEFQAHTNSEELAKRFEEMQPAFQRELLKRKDRRISVTPPADTPIENITVTAQYEGTTIFIVHLIGGSHLTVEVGREGKVYGIPFQLKKILPDIQDHILTWILPPVLERDKRNVSEQVKTAEPTVIFQAPKPVKNPIREVSTETSIKPMKRRHLNFQNPFNKEEPELPTGETAPYPTRFVPYTEAEVRKFLGKRRKQQDIDAVIEVLERFKQGWKDAEPIILPQGDAKISRIRAGNFRIAVQHIEGDQYRLDYIGDRKDFYDRYDK